MKDWPIILTAIIAIYGAILSTINLYDRRKEKKRQISVKVRNGFLTYPQALSPAMLMIEASNPGHIAVNLNSTGIILPDKRTMAFPCPEGNVTFPHNLPPGESCTVWTDLKKLAYQLAEEGFNGKIGIVGFYRDGVGKEHLSKKYKLDIDGWIKEKG